MRLRMRGTGVANNALLCESVNVSYLLSGDLAM